MSFFLFTFVLLRTIIRLLSRAFRGKSRPWRSWSAGLMVSHLPCLLSSIPPTHLQTPFFPHSSFTLTRLLHICLQSFFVFFCLFFYKSDLCTKQSTNPWGSHAKAVNKISTLWSEIIVFQYKGNIILPPDKLPFMSISLAHVFALILYSVLKTVQKCKIQFLFVHVLCKTC